MPRGTRERYVYPTNEIAGLWFSGLKSSARNKLGNFYYDGDTIYSYGSHFPIARHVYCEGGHCIFMTTRSYSVTTAEHLAYVRYTLSRVPVFYVECVLDDPSTIYEKFRRQIVRDREEVLDARRTAEVLRRYSRFVSLLESVNQFAVYFKKRGHFKVPRWMTTNVDLLIDNHRINREKRKMTEVRRAVRLKQLKLAAEAAEAAEAARIVEDNLKRFTVRRPRIILPGGA